MVLSIVFRKFISLKNEICAGTPARGRQAQLNCP